MRCELEEGISLGVLKGEYWEGDWKADLEEFGEFVDHRVFRRLTAYKNSAAGGFRMYGSMISSSRIVEEMGSFPLDWKQGDDLGFSPRHFEIFVHAVSGGKLHPSQDAKEIVSPYPILILLDVRLMCSSQGDANESDPHMAIDFYHYSTMIDGSNFEARLQSAAIRLRIADHQKESDQYVAQSFISLSLIPSTISQMDEDHLRLFRCAPLRSSELQGVPSTRIRPHASQAMEESDSR